MENIDLIKIIIKAVDRLLGNSEGTSDSLITCVTDRAGHDLRYAIDSNKLKNELDRNPLYNSKKVLRGPTLVSR